MNKNESTTRKPQGQPETFVVAKTDEGYRVFSPHAPASQWLVCDTGDDMTCTCPDFAANSGDPDWCCRHIRAVHEYMDTQNHRRPPDSGATGAVPANGTPPPKDPAPKKSAARTADSSMLIKRSLSPDGRIDSLSVEFSLPVGKLSSVEIIQQAERALRLQTEITQGYFRPKGNGANQRNGAPQRPGRNGHGSGVAAQLMNIEAMDTRRGRSLFINVFVENQVAKLFGDEEKLGEALAAAGYSDQASSVEEGMQLNLPCRAVTKRNGKYLNIERLLPAANGGSS